MDVYDGADWTDMDIEDLKAAIDSGCSIEEAAEFLCRADSVEEVARKAARISPVVPPPRTGLVEPPAASVQSTTRSCKSLQVEFRAKSEEIPSTFQRHFFEWEYGSSNPPSQPASHSTEDC